MNCEQQEWTDRYLFGELEGEERRRFEAKFATDQGFRAEVELQAEIIVGINSYTAAKPKVVPLRPTSKFACIKPILRVAAMVAFFTLANAIFQTANKINKALIAHHIEIHNDYNLTDSQPTAYYRDKKKDKEEYTQEDTQKDNETMTESHHFMNYPKQFEKRA